MKIESSKEILKQLLSYLSTAFAIKGIGIVLLPLLVSELGEDGFVNFELIIVFEGLFYIISQAGIPSILSADYRDGLKLDNYIIWNFVTSILAIFIVGILIADLFSSPVYIILFFFSFLVRGYVSLFLKKYQFDNNVKKVVAINFFKGPFVVISILLFEQYELLNHSDTIFFSFTLSSIALFFLMRGDALRVTMTMTTPSAQDLKTAVHVTFSALTLYYLGNAIRIEILASGAAEMVLIFGIMYRLYGVMNQIISTYNFTITPHSYKDQKVGQLSTFLRHEITGNIVLFGLVLILSESSDIIINWLFNINLEAKYSIYITYFVCYTAWLQLTSILKRITFYNKKTGLATSISVVSAVLTVLILRIVEYNGAFSLMLLHQIILMSVLIIGILPIIIHRRQLWSLPFVFTSISYSLYLCLRLSL